MLIIINMKLLRKMLELYNTLSLPMYGFNDLMMSTVYYLIVNNSLYLATK